MVVTREHDGAGWAAQLFVDERRGDVVQVVGLLVEQQGGQCQTAALPQESESFNLRDRAVGDREREEVILNNMGITYFSLERFGQALRCYHEALVIRAEIDDPYSTGSIVLNNIGEVYRSMLRFPSAVAEISRALEIFRRIGDRFGTGRRRHRCSRNSAMRRLTRCGHCPGSAPRPPGR